MRLVYAVVFITAIGLMGCAESESSQIKKARLVANENLRLKTELEQKTALVAELQAQLAKLQEDTQNQIDQLNKSSNEIVGQMILQQQQLQAENEKLKAELEQFKR